VSSVYTSRVRFARLSAEPLDALAIKSENLTNRPSPHDLDMVERARCAVADVATRIMNGQLSYLLGARLICAQRPFCAVPDDDSDFDVFAAVYSQSDHLPVGAEEREWAEDAVLRLQPEVETSEAWAAAFAKTAAENLVRRYGV
jgi:hypothetical protein